MRSLCQRVPLPLYPDEPGEIIEHREKLRIERPSNKGWPFNFRAGVNPAPTAIHESSGLKIQLKLHEVEVGERAELTPKVGLSGGIGFRAVTEIDAGP